MPAALPSPGRLADLVARLGGDLDEGLGDRVITAIVPPGVDHDEQALIPVLRPRYAEAARDARGVLLAPPSLAGRLPPGRLWRHPEPGWVVASLLGPDALPDDERHLATIDPRAQVADDARVGAGCVIRAGVVVGAGVILEPRVVLCSGVELRRGVRVGAGSVLGRAGFGWAQGPGGFLRVPHRGGVLVGEGAELGALCTVDAGVLAPTVIGAGARLDSHVHVGHNVQIGAGTFVAAQSGFAGSVVVGRGVRVGGQVGVADHITIGDEAQLAAKSGVIGDVPARSVVAGYPAVERTRWLRALARLFSADPRRRKSP